MNESQIESDIEPWSWGKTFSRAKTYLKLQLEGDDNWITRIIAEDKGISSKTINKIHDGHNLFRPYKKQKLLIKFP